MKAKRIYLSRREAYEITPEGRTELERGAPPNYNSVFELVLTERAKKYLENSDDAPEAVESK